MAEVWIPLISYLAIFNYQAINLSSAEATVWVLNVVFGAALGQAFAFAAFSVEVLVSWANQGFRTHASTFRIVEPLLKGVSAFTRLRGTFALAGLFVIESDPEVGAVVAASGVLVKTVNEGSRG